MNLLSLYCAGERCFSIDPGVTSASPFSLYAPFLCVDSFFKHVFSLFAFSVVILLFSNLQGKLFVTSKHQHIFRGQGGSRFRVLVTRGAAYTRHWVPRMRARPSCGRHFSKPSEIDEAGLRSLDEIVGSCGREVDPLTSEITW